MKANQNDIEYINKLYANRYPYYGELHDHSDSGGTSDGKYPLSSWITEMDLLKMDFAAILDHRQVRHMYLPEWKDGLFIAGTEPGTTIVDSKATNKSMHYNMIFETPDQLITLFEHFPEYQFTGGSEGHFVYPKFTTERFGQLIDCIREIGGFFVHPHPTLVMESDDPCDYWFRDKTGIEVFYETMDSNYTKDNYDLWIKLLQNGKRVWATAGGDGHEHASDGALTTIYAEKNTNKHYLANLRKGDFVCGAVGIRMCINDTLMGGECDMTNAKLIVCVSDFHKSVKDPSHKYRLDILSDTECVESHEISCEGQHYFSINTENKNFYRVEVFDTTENLRIAIGNPIWSI